MSLGNILSIKQKALQINLDSDIYGTFAEIGAGQETARQFFRVGGASGTIAKAMSAYDKSFSDDIYTKMTFLILRSFLERLMKLQLSNLKNLLLGPL